MSVPAANPATMRSANRNKCLLICMKKARFYRSGLFVYACLKKKEHHIRLDRVSRHYFSSEKILGSSPSMTKVGRGTV